MFTLQFFETIKMDMFFIITLNGLAYGQVYNNPQG